MPEFCIIDNPFIDLIVNNNAPRAIFDDGNGNTHLSVTFELDAADIDGKTIFVKVDSDPNSLDELIAGGAYPISHIVIRVVGDPTDMAITPRFSVISSVRDAYNNDSPITWAPIVITGDYPIILSDYVWYSQGYYDEWVEQLNHLFVPDGDIHAGVCLVGVPTPDGTSLRLATYLS